MGTIAVETAALQRDARMWGNMRSTMQGAADTLSNLPADRAAWSWVAIDYGLHEVYEALLAKTIRLLNEGSHAFESIEIALHEAAATYETQEDETAEEFEQRWQLRDR
jgi:hypothetical protein